MPDDVIPVDLAVNDDHGAMTNRVAAVHLPGLDLEAIDVAGVHFRPLQDGFRVSRRTWPARHLRSGVGNIYWERWGMDGWSAAAFLHWLRDSRLFDDSGGFIECCQWWDSGITDHAYARRLLIEAAKDDRL